MTDTSKEQPKMTVGLDLGDKYSYLFELDNESGKMIEEGRLRTTPDDLCRRFDSAEQMKVAIEVGTHSTWVNRVLKECGHEALVANPRKIGLIYGDKCKTNKLDAKKLARLARVDPKKKALRSRFPPDLGWLLVSQCQHDHHDQESYTGEEIGADGYEAGGDSPELHSNE